MLPMAATVLSWDTACLSLQGPGALCLEAPTRCMGTA